MTDCPERLSTGIGFIVTLRIYLLPAAFEPLKSSNFGDNTFQLGFKESLETEEERSGMINSFIKSDSHNILVLFENVKRP